MPNLQSYNFRNVVVTPFYTAASFFAPVSCIGGVSIPHNYFAHGRFGRIASRSISIRSYGQTISRPCVFGGYWLPIYGHFLIETLQRLYFIAALDPDVDIVFPYVMGEAQHWQREMLTLLGIRNRIIFLHEPTRFRQLYVPPPGAALGWHLTGAQMAALGRVEPTPIHGEKLFISRAGIGERGCINEGELEILFKERGWKIMRPEKLPVREQIYTLARAERVFAVSGSALHSVLLLHDAPQRFIVVPRIHNETYNIIAHAKCRDYHLLNVPFKYSKESAYSNQSQFIIDKEALTDILNESADFARLDAVKDMLASPQPPPANYQEIPAEFLSERPGPNPPDNMTWQILDYLCRGGDFSSALRKARWLMAEARLENYMKPVCYQLLKEGWPHEMRLFADFFNCSPQSDSYRELLERVISVIDSQGRPRTRK